MTLDVTICVATFGGPEWQQLAEDRAIPSAKAAGAREVVTVHSTGGALAAARNKALSHVSSEYVVFLDADDELAPGYLEALDQGDADVRAPAVAYVTGHHPQGRPKIPRVAGHRHDCTAACLPEGNWVVIGAAARTRLVQQVGGFRDWEWSEDWDLWLRMHLAGAIFSRHPTATYRAHYRADSRNRAPDADTKARVHWAIYESNGLQRA